MQIKQSNNENEHKDETKIISLAMTVSEIHMQGNDKKEVQVQGVKLKTKHETLHPCPTKHLSLASYKRPTINIIVCFAKLMHNFWDYANCETL